MAKVIKPIAYVEHPVSKEDKAELIKGGFKILDIAFKPEKLGEKDKVVTKAKVKAVAKK